MSTLIIKLKIPFECNPPIGVTPALTFTHWLPVSDQDAIRITEDGIKLSLWFDEKCTWWASQPKAEELKNHVNVPAHYVNGDLTVVEVPSDLASYMQGRDFARLPTESEQSLQSAYETLGEKILTFVLKSVNRLVAFARSKKGQYWLTEIEFDVGQMYSLFNRFEARGSVDNGRVVSVSASCREPYNNQIGI